MRRRHTPTVLHSVADLLAKPVATDQLLHTMIDRVVTALDAERGTLYLVDAATDELVSRVAHLPELSEIRLPPGRGIAGHVAVSGEAVITTDVTDEKRFFPGIDQQTGFQTRDMLTVPVQDARGRIRGGLQLLNRREGDLITPPPARPPAPALPDRRPARKRSSFHATGCAGEREPPR